MLKIIFWIIFCLAALVYPIRKDNMALPATDAMSLQTFDVGSGYQYAYKTNSDGSIGVEYLFNGQPISNSQFKSATGMDTGNIEGAGQSQWINQNYNELAKIGVVAGPVNPSKQIEGANIGPGSSTSITTTPNIKEFNGRQYDMNNQADALAYLQEYQNQINQFKNFDLTAAQRDYDSQIREIKKSLGNVDTTEAQTLKDLQQGYGLGTVNRQNYFANLSPNAFQSSQGTSQAYALGQLNEAGQQATNAANLNRTDINAQMGDIQSSYNDYNTQRALQAQQAIESGYSGAASAAQSHGWNVNAFRPSGDYTAQVDTSQYTPYLNFQQVANSPSQQAYGKVLGQQTPQPGNQSVNQFLGYTPNKSNYNYLNQYLQGYGGY
jgi:hypothetical protein